MLAFKSDGNILLPEMKRMEGDNCYPKIKQVITLWRGQDIKMKMKILKTCIFNCRLWPRDLDIK